MFTRPLPDLFPLRIMALVSIDAIGWDACLRPVSVSTTVFFFPSICVSRAHSLFPAYACESLDYFLVLDLVSNALESLSALSTKLPISQEHSLILKAGDHLMCSTFRVKQIAKPELFPMRADFFSRCRAFLPTPPTYVRSRPRKPKGGNVSISSSVSVPQSFHLPRSLQAGSSREKTHCFHLWIRSTAR